MDWTPIRKIAAAIIVAGAIDAGALLGVLSGALSWREAGIAAVSSALPVIRGYLVRDPEVRNALEASPLELGDDGTAADDDEV